MLHVLHVPCIMLHWAACTAQAAEVELSTKLASTQDRVHAALCNNLDTPSAMDALSDLVKAVNIYLAKQQVRCLCARLPGGYVRCMCAVLAGGVSGTSVAHGSGRKSCHS
jgi:cysteinyl-tRNA synthetase